MRKKQLKAICTSNDLMMWGKDVGVSRASARPVQVSAKTPKQGSSAEPTPQGYYHLQKSEQPERTVSRRGSRSQDRGQIIVHSLPGCCLALSRGPTSDVPREYSRVVHIKTLFTSMSRISHEVRYALSLPIGEGVAGDSMFAICTVC